MGVADPDARVKVNKNMWMALLVSMNDCVWLCLPKICINEINCINLYCFVLTFDTPHWSEYYIHRNLSGPEDTCKTRNGKSAPTCLPNIKTIASALELFRQFSFFSSLTIVFDLKSWSNFDYLIHLFLLSDVNMDNPDKKSIMMYVMCYFQVLPHSNIVIDQTAATTSPSMKTQQITDTSVPMQVWPLRELLVNSMYF